MKMVKMKNAEHSFEVIDCRQKRKKQQILPLENLGLWTANLTDYQIAADYFPVNQLIDQWLNQSNRFSSSFIEDFPQSSDFDRVSVKTLGTIITIITQPE